MTDKDQPNGRDAGTDDADDEWPFSNFDAEVSPDEAWRTIATPIVLVVPRPSDIDPGIDVTDPSLEWRIRLQWQDSRRADPEGLVLADDDGRVLDLAMFRRLREQFGASIHCTGQEGKVLAALHCAAYRADEPGIGAPAA